MSVRTLFSFSYTSDVKSLPGFVKGGRDKVPKELSSYASGLISGWSEKEIRDHVEDVATSLLLAIEHGSTGVYNIASGQTVSMINLAQKIDSCLILATSETQPSF